MNVDIISVILKFCSFETLNNFKLVNKTCTYLVKLELQRRIYIVPQKNHNISKDYICPNYIMNSIKQTENIHEILRLLSIFYLIYNSFEKFDWYLYNLPMKLLYMTNEDEFHLIFNHWLIQEYLKTMKNLWTLEDIFMFWYEKFEPKRQLILKHYILELYGCPEEYIYILKKIPDVQSSVEIDTIDYL